MTINRKRIKKLTRHMEVSNKRKKTKRNKTKKVAYLGFEPRIMYF